MQKARCHCWTSRRTTLQTSLAAGLRVRGCISGMCTALVQARRLTVPLLVCLPAYVGSSIPPMSLTSGERGASARPDSLERVAMMHPLRETQSEREREPAPALALRSLAESYKSTAW